MNEALGMRGKGCAKDLQTVLAQLGRLTVIHRVGEHQAQGAVHQLTGPLPRVLHTAEALRTSRTIPKRLLRRGEDVVIFLLRLRFQGFIFEMSNQGHQSGG